MCNQWAQKSARDEQAEW